MVSMSARVTDAAIMLDGCCQDLAGYGCQSTAERARGLVEDLVKALLWESGRASDVPRMRRAERYPARCHSVDRLPWTTRNVISVDDLRLRVPDGRHLWVQPILYRVAKPETPLADTLFGAHNLVGAEPRACLWCSRPYVSVVNPGPVCDGADW